MNFPKDEWTALAAATQMLKVVEGIVTSHVTPKDCVAAFTTLRADEEKAEKLSGRPGLELGRAAVSLKAAIRYLTLALQKTEPKK